MGRGTTAIGMWMLAGLFGCNALAGINEPIDQDVTPQPPQPVSAFLGKWTSDPSRSSASYANCTNSANNGPSTDLDYKFTVESLSDGVVKGTNDAYPSCQLTLAVQGNVASLKGTASCTFSSSFIVDYSEATFKVDDRVGTFEIKGKLRGESGCDYYGLFRLVRGGPVAGPGS